MDDTEWYTDNDDDDDDDDNHHPHPHPQQQNQQHQHQNQYNNVSEDDEEEDDDYLPVEEIDEEEVQLHSHTCRIRVFRVRWGCACFLDAMCVPHSLTTAFTDARRRIQVPFYCQLQILQRVGVSSLISGFYVM